MMQVTAVVAASENRAIGRDNQLLWRLPDDLKFFKHYTTGKPILMGRKTFESIGSKPLPNRRNLVISRTMRNWEGAEGFTSVEEALKAVAAEPEICIVGGEEIYRLTWEHLTDIRITRVHTHAEGDAFFPEIAESNWELVESVHHPEDEKHAFSMDFQHWRRK